MQRRIGFLFICFAAIPIAVFASTAWACGALTTLKADKSVARPGEDVSVTARNFAAGPAATPVPGTNTAVQIRWGSRTGAVLKEMPEGGNFTTTVKVPLSATPGWYVVNATQFNATTGVPKAGSPARTTVRVQGSAVAGSTAPWGGSAAPTSGGPGGPADLPVPALLLSVTLLTSGMALVFRDRRRKVTRRAPAV